MDDQVASCASVAITLPSTPPPRALALQRPLRPASSRAYRDFLPCVGARAALSCSPLPATIPSGTCRLRRLRKFRGHRGSVKALSSIDAATLASGGRDGNSLCGTTGYRSHAQHVQLRRVDSRRPQPHAVSHGRRLFCVRRHPPRVEPRRVVKVVDAS